MYRSAQEGVVNVVVISVMLLVLFMCLRAYIEVFYLFVGKGTQNNRKYKILLVIFCNRRNTAPLPIKGAVPLSFMLHALLRRSRRECLMCRDY